MQESIDPIGLELVAVIVVTLVLLSACLLALAPLRRLQLPFTVAVMLLGMMIGVAVQALEQQGYGTSHVQIVEQTNIWPSHDVSAAADSAHGGHAGQNEPVRNEGNQAHTSFALRLINEFVVVFRSAADGLSATLILFIFIPVLVFESAYNMELRAFIRNLLPITVLAIPGLILSTVICGVVVMFAGGEQFGITWGVALLFGAIVSATDPVAVVGLFKELGAPKRLTTLVEGESLLNDGTAIVLFEILIAFVLGTMAAGSGFGSQGNRISAL
jgi:NhaP-type Na+/H+ or K+/H+ antiporter